MNRFYRNIQLCSKVQRRRDSGSRIYSTEHYSSVVRSDITSNTQKRTHKQIQRRSITVLRSTLHKQR